MFLTELYSVFPPSAVQNDSVSSPSLKQVNSSPGHRIGPRVLTNATSSGDAPSPAQAKQASPSPAETNQASLLLRFSQTTLSY